MASMEKVIELATAITEGDIVKLVATIQGNFNKNNIVDHKDDLTKVSESKERNVKDPEVHESVHEQDIVKLGATVQENFNENNIVDHKDNVTKVSEPKAGKVKDPEAYESVHEQKKIVSDLVLQKENEDENSKRSKESNTEQKNSESQIPTERQQRSTTSKTHPSEVQDEFSPVSVEPIEHSEDTTTINTISSKPEEKVEELVNPVSHIVEMSMPINKNNESISVLENNSNNKSLTNTETGEKASTIHISQSPKDGLDVKTGNLKTSTNPSPSSLKAVDESSPSVIPGETCDSDKMTKDTITAEKKSKVAYYYNRVPDLQSEESQSMAGVMDRFKKKKAGQMPEWSRNGSFLNKPEVGWIHPDQQLSPDAGICYGVRYIGNVEVKESMKSLDFDTRTQVAREAISRVAEAAGLKTVSKKRKVDKRVLRMLGDNTHMHYAGANVNLTITTDSINLMVMETGEIIADHPMHVVSFASGGDAETLDFVSYVAKDPALGRACHVLECGGGLAEDVVTTVGQAFELRFKQYLQKQPKAVQIPDRRENRSFEGEKWGEEEEYYNDRPGACPPSPVPEGAGSQAADTYNSPCNVPVGTYMSVKERDEDGVYSEAKDRTSNLIDFSDGNQIYDNSKGNTESDGHRENMETVYDNRSGLVSGDSGTATNHEPDPFDLEALTSSMLEEENDKGQNVGTDADARVDGVKDSDKEGAAASGEIDLRENPGASTDGPTAPMFEEWYHGKISRKEAEKLLELDGDFLVRESSNSSAQFVLSGKQSGNVRHLLLVDPDGIVRTKDFIFDSVSHLINYHRQNGLPIITEGSELRLVRPIKTCISAI